MTYLRKSLLGFAFIFSTTSFSGSVETLCHGFLPENDLKIPISVRQVGGISRADFDNVLDQVEKYYTGVVSSKGGRLVINRLWSDDTVNASADRRGRTWNVNMYGGLARYPAINKDGFMLVACHELGHHIGGAPKVQSMWGMMDWASNEGQSDYFATLSCLRFLFTEKDNEDFVNNNATVIDQTLSQTCGTTYTTQAEKNLCVRMGMAGLSVSTAFKDLRKQTSGPNFNTPDSNRVSQTDDEHPATQCRLDTYYQGALCVHDLSVLPDDRDEKVGTCNESAGARIGVRPRCWYAP